MPNVSNYASYDGLGLAELVRKGDVTPRELLEDAYAAIDAINPALNGVVSRIPDLAEAEIAAGLPDGPFKGIPFLVKELGIQMKGAPSRCGSKLTEDLVAAEDTELATRFRAAGKVDLSDIAGHDDLRAESQTRQEHLHLFGGGVLRLVENDEGVVERTTAHVREWSDLDDARLHQLGYRFVVHHVVQCIVQRAQVRVDLLVQRSGKKTEPLPCLHCRTRQDDASDLLGLQCLYGLGHREVRLAGTCRPDAEHDRVRIDRVHVPLLVQSLGPDRLAATRQDVQAQDLGG